ncbi:MAG: YaiO family outer membrane beta-barrel protein [Terriglobales bacterium]
MKLLLVRRLLAAHLLATCLLEATVAAAQTQTSSVPAAAPGSSLPGLGALSLGLDGPGYIEVGGGHSALSTNYPNWTDFYLRGAMSGGRNVFNPEITREDRFGDNGWWGDLAWTRTLSEDWYGQISAGASVGGFFLNRYSATGIINRKLLPRRQLVLSGGGGFDQSKTVNKDARAQAGAAYYFQYPVVLQGGFLWTHTDPGGILARVQYLAATQGHEKEHFVSLRYEWGREGYEVIGAPVAGAPAYNVLFNFPEHTATGTYRQWIGPNWGLNFNIEQHQETSYHRLGGTVGVFIDF